MPDNPFDGNIHHAQAHDVTLTDKESLAEFEAEQACAEEAYKMTIYRDRIEVLKFMWFAAFGLTKDDKKDLAYACLLTLFNIGLAALGMYFLGAFDG